MTKPKQVDALYNPQWGAMARVDEPLHATMTAHHFEPQHTGGGCMAWQRVLDDGSFISICIDGCELGEWSDRDKAEWCLGRYDGEDCGFVDCDEPLTLLDALSLAERLPKPGKEDQDTIPVAVLRYGK